MYRNKYKYGTPEKSSRFICLRCQNINHIGDGIQRRRQKEKYHIKDLFCLNCQEVTKNMEIRWCDDLDEISHRAEEISEMYYTKQNT